MFPNEKKFPVKLIVDTVERNKRLAQFQAVLIGVDCEDHMYVYKNRLGSIGRCDYEKWTEFVIELSKSYPRNRIMVMQVKKK